MKFNELLIDEAATAALAARLATICPIGACLWLEGELGAGKSTFARAFIREFGVVGAIKSPTYGLIERYNTSRGLIAHMDLYRIADPGELEFLALDELQEQQAIWLIEWPEKGAGGIPQADIRIVLAHAPQGRAISLQSETNLGQLLLAELAGTMPSTTG